MRRTIQLLFLPKATEHYVVAVLDLLSGDEKVFTRRKTCLTIYTVAANYSHLICIPFAVPLMCNTLLHIITDQIHL